MSDKKPTKPANIIYGLEDKPPLWIAVTMGFQHICIYAISLVLPVLLVREMGGTFHQAMFLVSMSMFAGGIGVICQAFRKGPMGSGYLCPQVCTPGSFSSSLMAVKMGGLPLLFGMTFFSGATEVLFSRIMNRLRVLFPVEVTGLIVAMVGITVIRIGALNFLGLDSLDNVIEGREIAISCLTLGIMVGLNVWGRGKIRLFAVLFGMSVGYVASYYAGLIGPVEFEQIRNSPVVAFTLKEHPGWAFDGRLALPFFLTMVSSAFKSVGDLTTCQKINDAEWKRPDMANIQKGILADAVGGMAAGVLGGEEQSTSSSNVALSIATGVTSRVVAWAMGILLIALSFLPKFSSVFAIMPKPVIGATLIFALCFMAVAGFQIVMSRMMDTRKTFVFGLSLIFGLMVDIVPEPFKQLPPWLMPIFGSSLATATVSAIVLNLVTRIGIARRVRLEMTPGESGQSERVFTFMERAGATWGARKEVIYKATAAVNEFMEAAAESRLTAQPVVVEAAFDEFNLDVHVRYAGPDMVFPTAAPDVNALLNDPNAPLKHSGFVIRKLVDRISQRRTDGHCDLQLHFEH